MANRGFTILELVIVVAIVGILASMAIPRFYNSQLKAKTAEANILLGKVRETQHLWLAQWDCFVNLRRTPEAGFPPSSAKNDWVSNPTNFTEPCLASAYAFADTSLQPAGRTYYFYECRAQANPFDYSCNALGDLDNNGDVAEFIYCTDHEERGGCIPSSTGLISLFPFTIVGPTPGTF